MKLPATFAACAGLALAMIVSGCTSMSQTGSPYHPGPALGRALGTGVGVTAGNVAGVGVGFSEGVIQGAAAPFDNTTHLVRVWHTETTVDGRTIQVPQDILVDSYGRPVVPPPQQQNAPAAVARAPKDQ